MSLLKAKRQARAIVLIECDTCAGVVEPIVDWDTQAIIERDLKPLSHTFIKVEVPIGSFTSDTLLGVIQLIWSLRYPTDAWCQRRQYLELINCSVVDYTIVGIETGDIITLDTLPIYKPLFSLDKTLRALRDAGKSD